jgi:hypothetical protein
MSGEPKVLHCALWQRTSERGNEYLSGFLGKARIIGFRGEPTADGTPTWNLFLQPGREQDEGARPAAGRQHRARSQARGGRGMTVARAIAPLPPLAGLSRPDAFAARIRIFSDRSFQLDQSGALATLIPIELHDGTAIDAVAFLAANPRRWWTEKLAATHLGDTELNRAQWYQRPIRLVATPADWLRDPQTICVLDWWSCDLRALFGDVPKVICASDGQERFLRRRLTEQVAPRFKIEVAR